MMLTFLQFLNEARVPWDEYGSWVNSKTKEVLGVKFQDHAMIMHDKMPTKERSKIPYWDSYKWAWKNNWVRLTHGTAVGELAKNQVGIQGDIKDIRKIWRLIAREAMKSSAVIIDTEGQNQPFMYANFDLSDRPDKNKLLGYMT